MLHESVREGGEGEIVRLENSLLPTDTKYVVNSTKCDVSTSNSLRLTKW